MAKARKMRLFARRKIKTKSFMLKMTEIRENEFLAEQHAVLLISPQKPEMMWGGRVFYLCG
jgi:hypothetical protein